MLRWQWKDKMGKLCVKRNDQEFTVGIYKCNALAAFIYTYEENGKEYYTLYTLFQDKQHINNLIKEYGKVFTDDVASIELNMFFKDSKILLDVFVKQGYKVLCYYEEIK